MTTIRAHFDGKVFVPDEPVDLPQGRAVRFQFQEENASETPLTGLAALALWAESLPPDAESPGDGATQLDHYLYGLPKRDNP